MAVRVRYYRDAWWVFIDHKTRRKKKRIGPGKEGERAAKAVAENLEARLALGDTGFLEPDPITFKEYGEGWLSGYVAANLQLGTQEKYEAVLRKHWFPAIGHLTVGDVTRVHIRTVLMNKTREGMKLSTARLLSDVIKSCLNAAVEDELIAKNPAARAGKMLTGGQSKKKVEALSRGVTAFLLQTAQEKIPDSYPIILLLAKTGMRIGEALALQVNDIDFERREISVNRTWGSRSRIYGEARINVPKGGKSRRVDLSQGLCDTLKLYVNGRLDEKTEWMFPASRGGPLNPDTFRSHIWKPLLKDAGLSYVNPHRLRHTYATILIENGESLVYIKEQLGHSSIKITVDTNKKAVDRLDEDLTLRHALYNAPRRTLYAPREMSRENGGNASD
jgi:integrase